MAVILSGKAYQNFVDSIRTDVTKLDYDRALETFMKYKKIDDPQELLDWTDRHAEDMIMDFIVDQKNNKLAYSSIQQRIAAVKLFFEMNRRPLAWKLISKKMPRPSSKKDRGYTDEELRKMLDCAKVRERAILLALISTGCRVGGLSPPKIKHMNRIEKYGIYRFVIYENEPEENVTFCTPEATRAIDLYIEYRRRYGEAISGESWLFREEFDKRDLKKIANAKMLDEARIRSSIDELANDAGIRERISCMGRERGIVRHPVKLLHGCRKFFATQCSRTNIHPVKLSYLMGHLRGKKELGTKQLDLIYNKPEESDLLASYVMCIPNLTISEEEALRVKVEKLENTDREEMRRQIKAEVLEALKAFKPEVVREGLDSP